MTVIFIASLMLSFCLGTLFSAFLFTVRVYRPMRDLLNKGADGWKEALNHSEEMLVDLKDAYIRIEELEEKLEGKPQKDENGNIVSPIQRIRDGS